jgi:hypothetical protein
MAALRNTTLGRGACVQKGARGPTVGRKRPEGDRLEGRFECDRHQTQSNPAQPRTHPHATDD